jgi:hypothetical protein
VLTLSHYFHSHIPFYLLLSTPTALVASYVVDTLLHCFTIGTLIVLNICFGIPNTHSNPLAIPALYSGFSGQECQSRLGELSELFSTIGWVLLELLPGFVLQTRISNHSFLYT